MFELRTRCILAVSISLILALNSCSSSDTDEIPESTVDPMVDPMVDPVVDQAPDPAPVIVSSLTSFKLIAQMPEDNAVFADVSNLLPFAISENGTRVLIRESLVDDSDNLVHQFLSYDVPTNNAAALSFTPVSEPFPAFDESWTTMTYASPCDASIQRQGELSEAMSLSLGMGLKDICTNRESTQISDDGETVLMSASRTDDGSNVPVIFGVTSGTVTILDGQTLLQADPALAGRISTAFDPSLSADGRYVVATLIVTDGPVTNGQTFDFSAGTVVVDTRTGDARVVGLTDYQRFACENCSVVPVSAPVISGNGRYVVYEQAPQIQVPGEEPESDTTLHVYDINTNDAQQVRAGPRGTGDIAVSDNGARVAWRVGSDVQIAYRGSSETISLQEGFRFCTDGLNDCLFAAARFVTSTAIEMSGDGSALTVYLVLQQELEASPENRSELLHFDLDTGILSRVAPGIDGLFFALSDDGDSVALSSVDERGVETIAVLRGDVQD